MPPDETPKSTPTAQTLPPSPAATARAPSASQSPLVNGETATAAPTTALQGGIAARFATEHDGSLLQCFDLFFQPEGLEPGKVFKFWFSIENLAFEDLADLVVRTEHDPEFPKSPLLIAQAPIALIKAGECKQVSLMVKVNNATPVRDFLHYPLKLRVAIYRKGMKEALHVVAIHLDASTFDLERCSGLTFYAGLLIQSIKNLAVPKSGERPSNILLFGAAGSGKTTLIKTMRAALSGHIEASAVGVGTSMASEQHQSSVLRVHQLTPAIRVIDPWGWTPRNYKDDAVKLMVV